MVFYINQLTHEVHKSTCSYVGYPNVIHLGIFDYPSEAVLYALKNGYSNADGCAYCCPQSHTK